MQKFIGLNKMQQDAVLQILQREGVVPIVGSCGCGKTCMIALAAVTFARVFWFCHRRVIIYAETYEAVDENMKRIAGSEDPPRSDGDK